jgi:CHAT domain-containing protein/tetratricopeptide (TPR) repeat protein
VENPYADQMKLTCPMCGERSTAEIWKIVISDERPDLLARIGAGTLHAPTCPRCHRTGLVDAPLLVYRPSEQPALIFSPALLTAPAQDQQQASQLLERLREQLGDAWRKEWPEQSFSIVPRGQLAAALNVDPVLTGPPAEIQAMLKDLAQDLLAQAGLVADAQQLASFHDQYQGGDDIKPLDAGAQRAQRLIENPAFQASPVPFQVGVMRIAGLILLDRFRARRQPADLQQGLALLEEAVHRTAPDDPNLPLVLGDLGTALRTAYADTGEFNHIQRAIAMYRRALDLTPSGHQDRPTRVNDVGTGLLDRYKATGDMDDLEAAIVSFQQAVEQTTKTNSDLVLYLNNLGIGLRARFERMGKLDDLDQGIKLYQQAVALAPSGSPDLARTLNNLGNGLRHRAQHTGDLAALDEAISVLQRAVALTPPSAHIFPARLNNLGTVPHEQYRYTRDMQALDRAIEAFGEAVRHTPLEAPTMPGNLENLGLALSDRATETRKPDELAKAVEYQQRAVDLTPPDGADLPRYLSNLADTLLHYDELSHTHEHLPRAIDLLERSERLLPPESAFLRGVEINLARALGERFKLAHDPVDLQRVRELYAKAIAGPLEAAPNLILRAASAWGQLECQLGMWQQGSRALARAVDAFEYLYRSQPLLTGRSSWQGVIRGLHTAAAYALARSGNLRQAAVAIERGRARNLNDTLARDRADLARVQREHPDLYARYQDAAARIRQLESDQRGAIIGTGPRAQALSVEHVVASARQARSDLDVAVAHMRELPGYADFLTDPGWDDLIVGLQPDTPFVYLAATSFGGLALIVHRADTADEPQPDAVWLDNLSEEALRTVLYDWFSAYLGARERPDAWFDAVEQNLGRLWQLGVGPVLAHLETLGVREAMLIPTGHLGLLPLHAGCRAQNGEISYALDAIALRYIPSARVFVQAQRIAASSAADALVAVCEPLPVGAPRLTGAQAETNAIAALFDAPRIVSHGEATRAKMLEILPQAQVAHFACHGTMNWRAPLQSGLLMANDQLLTVQDLFDLQITSARLAVLSACETGIIGWELPDEVVALPAAFLQAGFAGVVASLWSVIDLSTALLMEQFYLGWRRNGQAPAEALRAAQQWLRSLTAAELGRASAPSAGNLRRSERCPTSRPRPSGGVSRAWHPTPDHSPTRSTGRRSTTSACELCSAKIAS